MLEDFRRKRNFFVEKYDYKFIQNIRIIGLYTENVDKIGLSTPQKRKMWIKMRNFITRYTLKFF